MPPSIKNLSKGAIFTVTVGSTDKQGPERGHGWLVLGGLINHVTGTESIVYFLLKNQSVYFYIARIDADINNSAIPLGTAVFFDTSVTPVRYVVGMWNPLIVTDEQEVSFDGGVDAYLALEVIDFLLE